MKKSVNKKRIVLCGLGFLLLLLIFVKALQLHAADAAYKSGYLYFEIMDGNQYSKVKLHVWRDTSITHEELSKQKSTWNIELTEADNTVNNHNVKLLKNKVTTKLDRDGFYYLFSIPISYTLPANHEVVDQTMESALSTDHGRCWLYETAGGKKYTKESCVDADTTKNQFIEVGAAQISLRTVNGVRYNTDRRARIQLHMNHPKYMVTFDAGSGTDWDTAQKKVTAPRGEDVTILPPSKAGYTFDGWDKVLTNIKGNITTKAKWTANPYLCTFHANGGTGTMAPQTISYDSTVALKRNTFQRQGYSFIGWSITKHGEAVYRNEGAIKMDSILGIDLYAVWKKNGVISDFTNVEEDTSMFEGAVNLEGGNGTTYDAQHKNSDYAHTDEAGNPGYFTGK